MEGKGAKYTNNLGPGLPAMPSPGLEKKPVLPAFVWEAPILRDTDRPTAGPGAPQVHSVWTSLASAPDLTANEVSGENGAAVWSAWHVLGL